MNFKTLQYFHIKVKLAASQERSGPGHRPGRRPAAPGPVVVLTHVSTFTAAVASGPRRATSVPAPRFGSSRRTPTSGLGVDTRSSLGRRPAPKTEAVPVPCLSFPACELSIIICLEQELGSLITVCGAAGGVLGKGFPSGFRLWFLLRAKLR